MSNITIRTSTGGTATFTGCYSLMETTTDHLSFLDSDGMSRHIPLARIVKVEATR